jgi:hypothetical protein
MTNPRSRGTRFKDFGIYDWTYRQAFLHYTESEAPEVLECLRNLCPKWQALIHDYPYENHLVEYLTDWQVVGFGDGLREWILKFYIDVEHRYKIDDLSLLPAAESKAWDMFLDFRRSYKDVLKGYGLTSDWLREGLLNVISVMAASPTKRPSLCYAYTHAWFPAHGADLSIQIEGWKIEESMQEFEARARAEFERTLNVLTGETAKFFEEQGYKRDTKPLDRTPVKWLVWWTVKRMSKADILAKIDEDRSDENKLYDVKTLEHHFRQLRKYDLPVRRG